MFNNILLFIFSLSYLLAGCKALPTGQLSPSINDDDDNNNNKNPPKDRQIKTTHDNGYYTTVCWTEITTIKENSLNGSLQAIKEYSIKFKAPHDISDDEQEEIYYGDDQTKQYEVFDLNTKKSKLLNFTKVEEENGIITSQHRQVTCGSGPVYTKTFKETETNKEIEIKVMPKFGEDTQSLVRSLDMGTASSSSSSSSSWVQVENIPPKQRDGNNLETTTNIPTTMTTENLVVGRKIDIGDMIIAESRNVDNTADSSTTEVGSTTAMPTTIIQAARQDVEPCKDVQCITDLPDVEGRELSNEAKDTEDESAGEEEKEEEEKEDEEKEDEEKEDEEKEDEKKEEDTAQARRTMPRQMAYLPIVKNSKMLHGQNKNGRLKKVLWSSDNDHDVSSSDSDYRYVPVQRSHRRQKQRSEYDSLQLKPYPLVRIRLQPDDIEDITRLLTRKLYDQQIGIFELYNRPTSEEKLCETCLPLGYKYVQETSLLRQSKDGDMYDIIEEKEIPEKNHHESSEEDHSSEEHVSEEKGGEEAQEDNEEQTIGEESEGEAQIDYEEQTIGEEGEGEAQKDSEEKTNGEESEIDPQNDNEEGESENWEESEPSETVQEGRSDSVKSSEEKPSEEKSSEEKSSEEKSSETSVSIEPETTQQQSGEKRSHEKSRSDDNGGELTTETPVSFVTRMLNILETTLQNSKESDEIIGEPVTASIDTDSDEKVENVERQDSPVISTTAKPQETEESTESKEAVLEEPQQRQFSESEPQAKHLHDDHGDDEECRCATKKTPPSTNARNVNMPFNVKRKLSPQRSLSEVRHNQQIIANTRNISPFNVPNSGNAPSYLNPYINYDSINNNTDPMWKALAEILSPKSSARKYQYVEKNYDVSPLGRIQKGRKISTNQEQGDDVMDSLRTLLDDVMKKLI